MKFCILISAFCLLTSVGFAGLSGTYTVKPNGGGDFTTLYDVGTALDSLGVSGECVFEIFGDTLSAALNVYHVVGSDSWTTTFRPGAGAAPVLAGATFWTSHFDRVRMQDLVFSNSSINASGSDGWRISRCRFAVDYIGIELSDCYYDTIDGNTFDLVATGQAHGPAITTASNDDVIFNNFFNCESAEVDGVIDLDHANRMKVFYNTIRLSPVAMDNCGGVWVSGEYSNHEVRNNIIVLGEAADDHDACVRFIFTSSLDSVLLDNNCYYVESRGSVGAWHTDDSTLLLDWEKWLGFGFDTNGINVDPMLVSATDLHLRQGSPCIGAGVPITDIGFDIDGDPRDPQHPDIGADEFTGGAVEESSKPQVPSSNPQPTILAGASALKRLASCVVFDAMGRRVMSPKSGICFLVEQSVVSSQHSRTVNGVRNTAHVRKVVLQR